MQKCAKPQEVSVYLQIDNIIYLNEMTITLSFFWTFVQFFLLHISEVYAPIVPFLQSSTFLGCLSQKFSKSNMLNIKDKLLFLMS